MTSRCLGHWSCKLKTHVASGENDPIESILEGKLLSHVEDVGKTCGDHVTMPDLLGLNGSCPTKNCSKVVMSGFVSELDFNQKMLVWDVESSKNIKNPTSKSAKYNQCFAFGGCQKLF